MSVCVCRSAMNSVQHLARLLQQSHDGAAPELVEYLKVSTSLLLLLLLSCAKSHMLSASRQQPHLLHVSAVDRRQTWSMDKS